MIFPPASQRAESAQGLGMKTPATKRIKLEHGDAANWNLPV
jgi:hypothetical protein